MAKVISMFPSTVEVANKGNNKTGENSMEAKIFLEQIIRPALKAACLWSTQAENLLLGTALVESNLNSVMQYSGGPALSFFQIEPATYKDVVAYINRRSSKKPTLLGALYMDMFPYHECLAWNMRLSVLIARMIYWRVPEPLPRANDIAGMAAYWKKYYNTEKGKGTIEHFIKQWESHIND